MTSETWTVKPVEFLPVHDFKWLFTVTTGGQPVWAVKRSASLLSFTPYYMLNYIWQSRILICNGLQPFEAQCESPLSQSNIQAPKTLLILKCITYFWKCWGTLLVKATALRILHGRMLLLPRGAHPVCVVVHSTTLQLKPEKHVLNFDHSKPSKIRHK